MALKSVITISFKVTTPLYFKSDQPTAGIFIQKNVQMRYFVSILNFFRSICYKYETLFFFIYGLYTSTLIRIYSDFKYIYFTILTYVSHCINSWSFAF